MNIKDLVPPLELCKQIPAGEFEDACFSWFNFDGEYRVCKHGKIGFADLRNAFPAPTLQEIMAAMQHCRVYKKTNGFYVAVKEQERKPSFSGATAALKLWLELNKKGVENGN